MRLSLVRKSGLLYKRASCGWNVIPINTVLFAFVTNESYKKIAIERGRNEKNGRRICLTQWSQTGAFEDNSGKTGNQAWS